MLSYFTDLRQTRGDKKIAKTVLKTGLKTKETTYNLWSLSQATQREHFEVFLEYSFSAPKLSNVNYLLGSVFNAIGLDQL
jgi:hypothetical protein